MTRLIDESKVKAGELNVTLKTLEHATARLQHQYSKSQTEIADTFQFYMSLLDEVKAEANKELDDIYNTRMSNMTMLNAKLHEAIDRVEQLALFMDRYRKFSSPTELVFFKQLIESKLRVLNVDPIDVTKATATADLEFISNFQAIRVSC